MEIVVLGAGGQLGRCFKDLQKLHTDLNYRFYNKTQLDISDPGAYHSLAGREIDVVINCAAYTKVDLAEKERDKAHKINCLGPSLLADFCENKQILLIHFSTDYVYGKAQKPIKETDDIAPVNYYGLSKWLGEEAIRNSGATYLIFRTAWLYSQYGHNFVRTMLRLSEDHHEIKVVEDQTGSPTYAADLANAIDKLLFESHFIKNISSGTYNFANHGAVTWYEFAREILKKRNVNLLPIPTQEYPTPAVRPKYSVLNTSLFEEVFHQTIGDWKDSLKRCMSLVKTG